MNKADPAARAALTLGGAFLVGAIPFANIIARVSVGQDLRLVGGGTVSSTAVYGIAGRQAFAASCVLDMAKGALAISLADGCDPALVAAAAGLAVAGHNWSPFLRGAGGRGVLPGIGVLSIAAPSGGALLLGGLVMGWAANDTGLGCFAAQCLLIPVLARTRGKSGVMLAAAIAAPMLLKRMVGDRPPAASARSRTGWAYLSRVLYDRDDRPGFRACQPLPTQTGSAI